MLFSKCFVPTSSCLENRQQCLSNCQSWGSTCFCTCSCSNEDYNPLTAKVEFIRAVFIQAPVTVHLCEPSTTAELQFKPDVQQICEMRSVLCWSVNSAEEGNDCGLTHNMTTIFVYHKFRSGHWCF